MSPLSGLVLLVLAVSLVPGAIAGFLACALFPEVGVWAGVFVTGFTFTSILDWIVAPKISGK